MLCARQGWGPCRKASCRDALCCLLKDKHELSEEAGEATLSAEQTAAAYVDSGVVNLMSAGGGFALRHRQHCAHWCGWAARKRWLWRF